MSGVHLTFFLTDRCNARCGHCFHHETLNTGRRLLSLLELQELLWQIPSIETVSLSGGEPFLREDIAEVVALLARGRPRSVFIPTNGFLPSRVAACVDQMLRATDVPLVVSLSVDGLPETHDRLRGVPGGFARLRETYRELERLKEGSGGRLRVKVGTVLYRGNHGCRGNLAEIRELVELVAREMPAVDFHDFEVLRGSWPDASLAPPTPDELLSLRETLVAAFDRGAFFGRGARLRSRLALAVKRLVLDLHLVAMREKRQPVPCRAPRTSIVIGEEGEVSFCELRPRVGSLRATSLREALDSDAAAVERRAVASGACHCTQSCALQRTLEVSPALWPRLLPYLRGASTTRKPTSGYAADAGYG